MNENFPFDHFFSNSKPSKQEPFQKDLKKMPVKSEAYDWLNNNANNTGYVIVIRGFDSWARVYLDLPVYELFGSGQRLSASDEIINNQLTNALRYPYTLDTYSTFEKYNVSYIIWRYLQFYERC